MIRRLTHLWGYNVANTSFSIGTLWGLVISRRSWRITHAIVQTGDYFKDNAIMVARDKLVLSTMSNEILTLPIGEEEPLQEKNDLQKQLCTDSSVTKLKVTVDSPKGWALVRPMPLPAFPMPMVSSFYVKADGDSAAQDLRPDERPKSGRDLIDSEVQAVDGSAGTVYDLLLDDRTWTISYVILDTGRWFPGRKVILPIDHLRRDAGDGAKLLTNLEVETIKEGPELNSETPVNSEVESKLLKYYRCKGR